MEQEIKELLSNHSQLSAEEIKNEDSLIDDLGFDSLDLAEIAMDIEEKYDITIKDNDLNWITVQDVINYLS